MKRIILSLTLTAGPLLAHAQVAPAALATVGTSQLTGTVRDAASQPVPYATVALLGAATGQPLTGTTCDEAGHFVLGRIAAGTYRLQVSFIGYQTLTQPGLVFSVPGGTRALGNLTLQAAPAQLSEVVVQGQRAAVEQRVDRLVYHADQDQTTRGGDATDVLRRVPLLSLDQDGNVSLRGSTSIKVLINGRPSTITAGSVADALKQLPADQIQTVEVITSPSAKYDAEGAGGIINILTKQDKLAGKLLRVTSTTGLRATSLALNASYQTGRMGFTLGGSGRSYYNLPGAMSSEQRTYDAAGGLTSRTRQTADNHYRDLGGLYTLGWTFDPSPRHALWASVQTALRNIHHDDDNLLTHSDFYQAGASTGSASDLRTVRAEGLSNTVDVSLGYVHTTSRPRQELSVLGLYSRNNRQDNFTSSIFERQKNGATLPDYQLRNLNPSFNQELTGQLDYQTPLGDKQLLEVGAKNINRQVRSDYAYQQASGLAGDNFVPLPDAGLSNAFRYRQNVAAAYAAYTTELPEQVTLKAGLRYEHTTLAAAFASGAEADLPAYGALMPSLHASRKLASGNVLKAAYARRLQRPSLAYLNPNLQAANPLDLSQGNPLLQPEFTNNYELGYTTSLWGTALTLGAFARTTAGSIQGVRRPVTAQEAAGYGVQPGAVLTTYANIGQEAAYGGNLYADAHFGKKLTVTAGPEFYYAVLRNNAPELAYQARNQGFVLSGRVAATYAFNERWRAQSFASTSGRRLDLQGYATGFALYSLAVQRTFADGKGSVGLGTENFFSPRIPFRTEYASPLLVQSSSVTPNRMTVKVTFSYRLGKLAAPIPKKEVTNDDLK